MNARSSNEVFLDARSNGQYNYLEVYGREEQDKVLQAAGLPA